MKDEVIVVGAGPAGSVAAAVLARAGRRVRLLDRAEFPRDKTCGDAVPRVAVKLLADLGLAGDLLANPDFFSVDTVTLIAPNGRTFTGRVGNPDGYTALIAPRLLFDDYLRRQAVARGARFEQMQVLEPLIEGGVVVGVRGKVHGKTEERRARLVIAADGSTSVIARALRGGTNLPRHRAVAVRAYFANVAGLDWGVEFYFNKELAPGYGWIFPTGPDSANIGIGMRADVMPRGQNALRQAFSQFLAYPPVAERLTRAQQGEAQSWPLAFGSQDFPRVYDGAILCGDAGAFINPLTGGGIHHALVTGNLAAETVLEALARNRFDRQMLTPYERAWRKALFWDLKLSSLVQQWLIAYPQVVDWVMERLSAEGLAARYLLSKL